MGWQNTTLSLFWINFVWAGLVWCVFQCVSKKTYSTPGNTRCWSIYAAALQLQHFDRELALNSLSSLEQRGSRGYHRLVGLCSMCNRLAVIAVFASRSKCNWDIDDHDDALNITHPLLCWYTAIDSSILSQFTGSHLWRRQKSGQRSSSRPERLRSRDKSSIPPLYTLCAL